MQQPARNGDLLAPYGSFSFQSIYPVPPEDAAAGVAVIARMAVAVLLATGIALLVTRRGRSRDRIEGSPRPSSEL